MASTSEMGHGKNVANFERLTSNCNGFGATYNPSNASIKPSALGSLLISAKNSISAEESALATYKKAIAARKVAFVQLSELTTRVLNALKASGTTVQVDDSAKSFAKKIQGRRTSSKATKEKKKIADTNGKPIVENSSYQMSFDSRIDNFDKFVKLISSVTLYAPNEADLKVTALTTYLNDLKTKNLAVVNAETALSNARIARNAILYNVNTGLVDISVDVKTYIKSVYGATSPQYKQVSSLKFTNYN